MKLLLGLVFWVLISQKFLSNFFEPISSSPYLFNETLKNWIISTYKINRIVKTTTVISSPLVNKPIFNLLQFKFKKLKTKLKWIRQKKLFWSPEDVVTLVTLSLKNWSEKITRLCYTTSDLRKMSPTKRIFHTSR